MGLRHLPRIWLAAISLVAAAAAPVAAEAPVPAAPGLTIRVGQADDFSRVEFHWAAGARMSTQRTGQTLTISFNRDAKPDVSTLQVVPLKWLKSTKVVHQNGGVAFVFTLADDGDAVSGEADGADFVNIFEKKPDAAAPADAAVAPIRANPVPQSGTLAMRAAVTGQQLRLDFPWVNPAGAAVFRRGDAIWIVFDANARLDLSQAPKNITQYVSMQSFSGPGWSAVRIVTRAPEAFVADENGSDWGVTLEPFNRPAFSPVKLARDDSRGPAALTAPLAGASGVFWIDDPAVGDKIGVVTALGPPKGIPARRDLFELSLLESAQGLAVEPHVDDLSVAYAGDIVTMSRPKGLALSPAGAGSKLAAAGQDAPIAAALPGLIDVNWSRTPGGFINRYDALLTPVGDEQAKGIEGPTAGHMALARFLLGEGLSFETIGLLNDALRTHPALGGEAEFRALRGMARVMAGRYKEAETDFASPALEDDPAASLWRGYIFAKMSQWADAKKAFSEGAPVLGQFPAVWRARFSRAAGETALGLGDVAGARSWLTYSLGVPVDPVESAETRLVQARFIEQQGNTDVALAEYQSLEQTPTDAIAGPATLRATQIQLDKGTINPAQAAAVFDGLRFRWRGGSFELETIRALGQLYLTQGRYREALEALRSAGQHLPDLPEAVQLQADLNAAFKSLFLDGQADGLQPVQALALFYDFKELTPVGADGDAMVRRLTRRLVDVDLLPQAEELLKYQVDNRLDGVPKAQVATDLAVIYLMDRKPEDAMDTINASRTTILPSALNLQRRIVSARALTALGQYDTALEMIGTDTSADAIDARSEIVWKQKAWPAAASLFEKMLGDRYKTAGPLASDQEGKLLRAAVAYSLAGDDVSLARLRTEYGGFIDGARNPEALRVALSGINDGHIALADFSRMAADNQIFEGWVDKMKDRFRQAAPPAPRPAVTAQQVTGSLAGAG